SSFSAAFLRHRRLRGGGDKGQPCEGASGDFGTLRGLRLGGSYQTDVFELHLNDPQSQVPLDAMTISTSLAVAMRQALATRLGIDPREVGWALSRSRGHGIQSRGSIILYDMAFGGAGYVSTAAAHLDELMEGAR